MNLFLKNFTSPTSKVIELSNPVRLIPDIQTLSVSYDMKISGIRFDYTQKQRLRFPTIITYPSFSKSLTNLLY